MSVKLRLLAAAGVALAILTLAGCVPEEKREDPIDAGIRCAKAGGDWTWSEWSGYHCEFKAGAKDTESQGPGRGVP